MRIAIHAVLTQRYMYTQIRARRHTVDFNKGQSPPLPYIIDSFLYASCG